MTRREAEMQEPMTESGRRLHDDHHDRDVHGNCASRHGGSEACHLDQRIVQVEREARASARADEVAALREALLDVLFSTSAHDDTLTIVDLLDTEFADRMLLLAQGKDSASPDERAAATEPPLDVERLRTAFRYGMERQFGPGLSPNMDSAIGSAVAEYARLSGQPDPSREQTNG